MFLVLMMVLIKNTLYMIIISMLEENKDGYNN